MDNNSSASESTAVSKALPEAQPLLEFFETKFSLKMINAKDNSTTKGGTNRSYFSYHNPIVSIVDK